MTVQKGKPGRPVGSISKDKIELRAMLQEKVLEFTELRRQKDLEDGLPPHEAQEIMDEYDPVVALALVAVDRRTSLDQRIKCNAEVAQYVRPKLKSVDVTMDPEAAETLEQRRILSERLTAVINLIGEDKPTPRANPPAPTKPEGDEE